MKLYDKEIDEAYSSFTWGLVAFLGIDTATATGPRPLRIVIDDKEISRPADMGSTNGRYFFREPEKYHNLYIPHADSPGVYMFFDSSGAAIYIGKSEVVGGIGKRVSSHIGRFDGDRLPYLAFREAQYVITIPFVQAPWLAVAFESFLLSKFTFQHNLSLSQRDRAEQGEV